MAPQKADEYGASELVELARSARLDTAKRLLAEETGEGGKGRSTVVAALKGRVSELEEKAADAAPAGSGSEDFDGLPQGAEVTFKQTASGPTAAQKAGRTAIPEQVAQAKADRTVPAQDMEFADPPRVDEVQVDPHGPGAARTEAAAAQVGKTIADGEGPFLGTGIGKLAPPAPAFAPGEPEPSGSHAAGMNARALGAAPPAPTRFDGLDTGQAPRPEVGLHDPDAHRGGAAGEFEPEASSGPTTDDGSEVVHDGEGEDPADGE